MLNRILMNLLGLLLCASLAHAGEPRTPLGPRAQKVARWASWGTLIAGVALDARVSWQCEKRLPCFGKQGLRLGVTYGAVGLLKTVVHRDRPCAPNDCGADKPNTSFCSGHTAGAFQTLGGPPLKVALPLAIGTGAGRWLGGVHWPSDTLACAGIGGAASLIR